MSAALACVGIAFVAGAQTTPVGQLKSLSHAIHAVDDLDTTLAFYRDVFGIDGKAQDFPNPAVSLLTNAPGVALRLSMVGSAGRHALRVHAFQRASSASRRRPGTRIPAPPVSSCTSGDIDALVAAAKKAGAAIVTTGGAPLEIDTASGKARSIVLRDPDGFFLQLVQDAPRRRSPRRQRAPRFARVHDGRRRGDASTSIPACSASSSAGASAFAQGRRRWPSSSVRPRTVEFRRLAGTLPPGTAVDFTEFRGVPRTKFHLRVRDPGAPAMAVQVTNIEGMVAQMKAAGVNLLSANGALVDFGNGVHNIFVEDPNGMNLELFERSAAPPSAPRN